ncbi:MAG: hypothetical protein NC938_01020 [Candidatus Omnitrophica bacterium]|nr:hypothetical protein [Candidatus Omnitrophota bacterium]MCM8790270.1 hypothetical protein [Candidatus Omnitrophota bacterium]
MIVKKKSLVVALVSSLVICLVLVLTLVGYAVYLELKEDELNNAYQAMLHKVNAKYYAKYIEIAKLSATFETSGALKGQNIVEGIIRNKGYRDISDMLLKVNFLDRDGAIVYDVVFRPQEPALGSSILTQVSIPYLYESSKNVIRPEGSLRFKRILTNCPAQIASEIKNTASSGSGAARWSGKLDYEILTITF